MALTSTTSREAHMSSFHAGILNVYYQSSLRFTQIMYHGHEKIALRFT